MKKITILFQHSTKLQVSNTNSGNQCFNMFYKPLSSITRDIKFTLKLVSTNIKTNTPIEWANNKTTTMWYMWNRQVHMCFSRLLLSYIQSSVNK